MSNGFSTAMNENIAAEERNFGPQRIGAIMDAWGLSNHDMVLAADWEQLTHKQVQRARSGRRLTLAMMQKITRVLNTAALAKLDEQAAESFTPYMHRELFSYAKGHPADWQDPNSALYPR